VNPALLLLTDSRLPAGGHAHSGGAEQAIASGALHDLPSLAAFLRGRLHTAGLVAAAFAAAACTHASASTTTRPDTGEDPRTSDAGPEAASCAGSEAASWTGLDAELDARTASPAQRDAAKVQGRLLLRVARRLWPSPVLDGLARAVPDPHHPIALGAAAYAAGASPEDAALAAAYHSITGPATAAVRLLGLDPVAVHGLLAGLAPALTITATTATAAITTPTVCAAKTTEQAERHGRWVELPALSAPALDLLAERHARAATRLFVS
jgi:urease accessory protein UreF